MISFDDLFAVGFLVFLEGILSIDNALVLALIVRNLPKDQQKKALTYGIVGAVVFRIIAISLATYLMKWIWVKFAGGAYLLYLSLHDLYTNVKGGGGEDEKEKRKALQRGFWATVMIVELTDIAFAIDSILTAVAMTSKTWVVMTGGFLGLLMMRFAASLFIRLLEKFPRFEPTAYILVFVIGIKLIIDGLKIPGIDFQSATNPAFWVFWSCMALSLCFGFTHHSKKAKLDSQNSQKLPE